MRLSHRIALAVIGVAASACRRDSEAASQIIAESIAPRAREASPPAPPSAVPPPKTPAEPPRPAAVESLRVPGDLTASMVRALDGSAPQMAFVPGLCSNANAYLQTFPEAARAHGGIVALEGDLPCGSLKDFRSFSWDAAKLHARIGAALAASGVAAVPRAAITLVGYSQGAALGEQLAQRWPERYARFVLIGAPTDPAAVHFAQARAVVTMSCTRDVPGRMREASRKIAAMGVASTYVEMPGCSHGNIADGEVVFAATFDWLFANATPGR